MKSLTTIQKTFRVFQVLSKVFMILSFVAAGLALLGVTCALVWRNGGIVVGADFETMLALTDTSGVDAMIAHLLSEAVFELTDGVLLLFAFLYFKAERADGTPFTHSGARRIKNLGIKVLVLPLVAIIISAVMNSCFGLPSSGGLDYGVAVVLGVTLILASLVFRYGADLEGEKQA